MQQVEKMMQGVIPSKWESRDEQEVRGYYELLKNVFDSWKERIF